MDRKLIKSFKSVLKGIFIGCVCAPTAILLLLFIIFLFYIYVIPPPVYEEYIPQMEISLKLNKLRGGNRARLYIGNNNEYSDYVEFKYYQLSTPDIYYNPKTGFYVIDEDSMYQVKIVRHKQSIKYINRKLYRLRGDNTSNFILDYQRDSLQTEKINQILGHPIYKIGFNEHTNGFYILNDSMNAIYSSDNGFYSYAEKPVER